MVVLKLNFQSPLFPPFRTIPKKYSTIAIPFQFDAFSYESSVCVVFLLFLSFNFRCNRAIRNPFFFFFFFFASLSSIGSKLIFKWWLIDMHDAYDYNFSKEIHILLLKMAYDRYRWTVDCVSKLRQLFAALQSYYYRGFKMLSLLHFKLQIHELFIQYFFCFCLKYVWLFVFANFMAAWKCYCLFRFFSIRIVFSL